MVIFKDDLCDFLEVGDLPEKEVNVKLLFTLASALVILLHGIPVEDHSEFGHEDEEKVAEKDDEVEVVRAKGASVVLLEDSVPKVELVAVLRIEVEEHEQEGESPEESSDVGESLVKFLKVPLEVEVGCSFAEVELEVGVARSHAVVLADGSVLGLDAGLLLMLLPGEDGGVSFNVVLAEEEVGRNPSEGVKGEVVPVLQVIADVGLLVGVYHWVYVVEVEGELPHRVQEAVNVRRVQAACVRKV